MDRRVFLAAGLSLLPAPAFAATLDYRGFHIDVSDVDASETLTAAVQHQLDIAADCGAKADVIAFFQSQKIALRRSLPSPPGRFSPEGGTEIVAADLAPERPIILHELLHAYHFYQLPDGVRNMDVLTFFARAKTVYPPTETHGHRTIPTYLLTNPKEFFAVTASLYLWGFVDREPHTRARLKTLQPVYYDWLGDLFGVRY